MSQLLTLFTTPVIYIYLETLIGWVRSKRRSVEVPALLYSPKTAVGRLRIGR